MLDRTVVPFAVNEIVSSVKLNRETTESFAELMAPWQDYVPSWTSTTGSPAIGNGTLLGRWTKVGSMVTCSFTLEIGSTTNQGTGTWAFGFPTPARSGILVTGSGYAGSSPMLLRQSGAFIVAVRSSGANLGGGDLLTNQNLSGTLLYEAS